MRKLLLLILGTICLISYSQSRYESDGLLFKVDQSSIKVYLNVDFEDGFYNSSNIGVTSRIGWHWRGLFPKSCQLFQDFAFKEENESVASLFQHLYNWIKEIIFFSNNYNRYDIKDFLKYSERNELIARNGYVSIKDATGDVNDRYIFNFEAINNFKRQLIEYTNNHGIIIRP